MRKCEEKLRSVHFAGIRDWISRVVCGWQVAKRGTCVKHVGELKSHASCCTTGQKSQAGQTVNMQLELATQSSRESKSLDHFIMRKTDLLHSKHTPV